MPLSGFYCFVPLATLNNLKVQFDQSNIAPMIIITQNYLTPTKLFKIKEHKGSSIDVSELHRIRQNRLSICKGVRSGWGRPGKLQTRDPEVGLLPQFAKFK